MLQALLPALGAIADKLVDRIPNPAEREAAKIEAEKMLLQSVMDAQNAQVEVNKVEAASSSVFVAGWRPGLGWVCVAGYGYEYLARPLLVAFGHPAPTIGDSIMELTFGMLGLSGLRTFEKFKGVARS